MEKPVTPKKTTTRGEGRPISLSKAWLETSERDRQEFSRMWPLVAAVIRSAVGDRARPAA